MEFDEEHQRVFWTQLSASIFVKIDALFRLVNAKTMNSTKKNKTHTHIHTSTHPDDELRNNGM